MPGTIEEVEDSIRDKQGECDNIIIRDPDALNIYQERCRKIQVHLDI